MSYSTNKSQNRTSVQTRVAGFVLGLLLLLASLTGCTASPTPDSEDGTLELSQQTNQVRSDRIQTIDGIDVFISDSGDPIRDGWFEENGDRYYADPDGALASGWLTVDGLRYWFDPDTHIMQTGWIEDGGTWFLLNDSGTLNERATVIRQLEDEVATNPHSDGRKYESANQEAGGQIVNGEHGYWCGTFIWWGFEQAGLTDLWGSDGLETDPDYLARQAMNMGQYRGGTVGIQPGDLLLMYFKQGREGIAFSHVALVIDTDEDGITVIEGNVGTDSSTFDRIRTKVYDWDDYALRGYYRINYRS